MAIFKKMFIKHQLMLIAALVILSMVFIVYFTYEQISKIIVVKNKAYAADIIQQIQERIEANGSQMNKIIASIAYDGTIQKFLIEQDYLKRIQLSESLDNLFGNITQLREDILDIVVLGDQDIFYSMRGSTFFVSQYKELFALSKQPYYTEIVTLNNGAYQDEKSIIAGMAVYSTNPNIMAEKNIGVIAIVVKPDTLTSSIEKVRNDSDMKFYLLDRNHNTYYTNDKDDQFTWISTLKNKLESYQAQRIVTIHKERHILQSAYISSINGVVVSVMPEKRLLQDVINLRKKVIFIIIISLILISIPAVFTFNNILLPIKKFLSFISGIREGELNNLKKRIQMEGYSEMSILANKFNQMLDEIEGLTYRLIETNSMLYRTELEKKQAELNFLVSQINPHFLYNTLESIKALAAMRGAKEILDMTKALGRILRYGINASDEVTLKEELGIVKDYLHIQQVRFKERMEFHFDISEETLECIVPKMILQPVIENAIFHGLEPSMNKGKLFISGKIENENTLVICVKDNGVGISRQQLSEIQDRLVNFDKDPSLKVKAGIGVTNVNNRIKLKWGKDYGLSIMSEKEIGTEAIFTIPVRSSTNVQSGYYR